MNKNLRRVILFVVLYVGSLILIFHFFPTEKNDLNYLILDYALRAIFGLPAAVVAYLHLVKIMDKNEFACKSTFDFVERPLSHHSTKTNRDNNHGLYQVNYYDENDSLIDTYDGVLVKMSQDVEQYGDIPIDIEVRSNSQCKTVSISEILVCVEFQDEDKGKIKKKMDLTLSINSTPYDANNYHLLFLLAYDSKLEKRLRNSYIHIAGKFTFTDNEDRSKIVYTIFDVHYVDGNEQYKNMNFYEKRKKYLATINKYC